MSAIAGLALRQGAAPGEAMLAAMAGALARRGPGAPGLHVADTVGLAQLGREGGPEVAGALALASAGGGHGEHLALYRQEGLEGVLGAPGGPAAIALHDRAARRLLLARDPFGVRPLYMAQVEGGIAFASAPRALLAAGLVRPRIRREARDSLVQMQFTTGAETIFEGISRVLPGEAILVAEGAVVERRRRPALPEGGPIPATAEDALERLDAALEAAVLRLAGHGGCGLLLSGAVESAALAALAARAAGRAPPAFAAWYDMPGAAEESEAAATVARAVGARLEGLAVTEAMAWRHLPEIVAAMDDPAADYAILPTWFLARAAGGGPGALLSAEGAEELLAGYGRYRSAMRPWWLGGRRPRALGTFDHVKEILREAPSAWRDGFTAAEAAAAVPGRTRLMAAQAADVAEWLPNNLLVKLDRCLGAHGVEARLPFLDPAVVAACWRLPDALKLRGRVGKWLLREWLERRLPQARPWARRPGPAVPLAAWIAGAGERLGPLVAAQPGVAELARPDRVAALFRAAGTDKHRGFAAWHLLFYALWHRAHVEGVPPEGDVWEVLSARG